MNHTSTLSGTNSSTTGLPVDIPEWALAEEPDSLGRLLVSPTLGPDAFQVETSTHTLGDGVVADPRWPWDPNAADLYAQLLGEPWRAPGTRLIGTFVDLAWGHLHAFLYDESTSQLQLWNRRPKRGTPHATLLIRDMIEVERVAAAVQRADAAPRLERV